MRRLRGALAGLVSLRASLCVIALLPACALWTPRAEAAFHLWQIVEVYTNHDGSVQFIELSNQFQGEHFVSGHQIQATSDGVTKTFTFSGNLNTGIPTANRRMLIATPGFGALPGGVTPDYTLPNPSASGPFFNPNAASVTVTFVGVDSVSFAGSSLPTNGTQSLHFTLAGAASVGTNSPTNFSGTTGSVNLPSPPPRVAGDFDGDGRADVLWRNGATGENYLYPMNGTSIGAGEGYVRTVANLAWKIAGVGDLDGDGKADIFWRNASTGENYVYFMNGTAIQSEGYLRTVADTNWQVAGVGDFNGDGKDDVLWRNTSTGENYLYPMDGLVILPSEGYLRTVADQAWQVAGVGKFDAGATADILWRNSSTGENYLYLMNGTSIAGEGYLRTVSDQAWQVAGVGDFDGDGRSDILWRNSASGENYLYLMNGAAIAGEGYLRAVADLNWKIAALADYDGNGTADILWRNASTGENYLYLMSATSIAGEGYTRTVGDSAWQIVGMDRADEPPELAGITMRHNQVRAAVDTATALAPLQWDAALQATAAAWAAQCQDSQPPMGLIDHNPNRSAGHPYYVGESIFGSGGNATAQQAVDIWAAEKANYNYATNTCNGVCGHYTQIVWRNTVKLGCAKHTCPALTFGSAIVCNYGPGGNTGGRPY